MSDFDLFKTLKQVRKEKRLTQKELAQKAHINPDHYGRIERGENMPFYSTLIKICNTLDITIQFNINGQKENIDLFLKIKQTRKEKQLTQSQLARESHIDPDHYGRIERKEIAPNYDTLTRLCKALDITIQFNTNHHTK